MNEVMFPKQRIYRASRWVKKRRREVDIEYVGESPHLKIQKSHDMLARDNINDTNSKQERY